MANDIKLELKPVKEITGKFVVPSYQRGYRWTDKEVERMLEDFYNIDSRKAYCLQPIVVRKNNDAYELIDGQQRLTTIYLLYTFLHNKNSDVNDPPAFSLTYTTREKSGEFLKSIDLSLENENADFWFMSQAYKTIESWFVNHPKKSTAYRNIPSALEDSVNVIWYEVSKDEDVVSLFARLNIGKIPLTSSELVKAMFLSNDSKITAGKQEEIAQQWDHIERELQDDRFWYFLSNQTKKKLQTRIDLILNIMANNSEENRDKYATFFYFDSLRHASDNGSEGEVLAALWDEIQHTYLHLKDWYENHELYHKIGYLVASESSSIQKIYNDSKGLNKDKFKAYLDDEISNSINIGRNYADLSYEKPKDKNDLQRLLLLFNVESVRQNGEKTEWFPFHKYKIDEHDTANVWTLEHIHAQQSEGMKTQDAWREWLTLQLKALQVLAQDNILTDKDVNSGELNSTIQETQKILEGATISGTAFENLQGRIVNLLSVRGNNLSLHNISNLALLNSGDNAALSNSTFDVKRDNIIERHKKGFYIPFCTEMVFLKYYSPSENSQLHFWSQIDRESYVKHINKTLLTYLGEENVIRLEVEE